MTSSDFEPAYLLHHRPFRDSSLVAEFFSVNHGRVPAVVRGARGKSARSREAAAALQSFQLLDIQWRGQGELKTLQSVEMRQRLQLGGNALYAALYLNELTLRALHRLDPHPRLWESYQETLQALSMLAPTTSVATMEPRLRLYELHLLEQLGYGLSFEYDLGRGEEILADAHYLLSGEGGFCRVDSAPVGQMLFSGEILLRISRLLAVSELDDRDFDQELRRQLKQVCRLALKPVVGNAPLKSRELFRERRQ